MKPGNIIIYFAVYSFTGWLLEIIYRSYTQKRFINAGFLFGPFVPIYGTGALIIIGINIFISPLYPAARFFIYVIVLSFIEYITGELFEYYFRLKLWDYSDTKYHIKGKVNLLFSLTWGSLAIILTGFIHPAVSLVVNKLDKSAAPVISLFLTAYFTADTAFSAVSLRKFRDSIAYLYEKYVTLSSHEVQNIINSFQRILRAFPHLNKHLHSILSENLKNKANNIMGKITEKIESIIHDRKPVEKEYSDIVRDILLHDEFMKLQNFFHHNSSIYEHARIVSYVSYRICKYLNLDYRSAARGGLLHDFFLYDWRNHREPDLAKNRLHGRAHPEIALRNSMKHFELNDIEKDIIIKHMWPLTFRPPKYQESFVVTFADKYIASREYIGEFRKRKMKRKKKIMA